VVVVSLGLLRNGIGDLTYLIYISVDSKPDIIIDVGCIYL
jgi:hypothetical protein